MGKEKTVNSVINACDRLGFNENVKSKKTFERYLKVLQFQTKQKAVTQFVQKWQQFEVCITAMCQLKGFSTFSSVFKSMKNISDKRLLRKI